MSDDLRALVSDITTGLLFRGVDLTGPCGAFQITKRVAWELRHTGCGLLSKPGGNHCAGYSVDYVVFRDRYGVDILGDAGGANTPAWNVDRDPALLDRWRAPIDPGDGAVELPPPPPDRVTLAALDQHLAELRALVVERDDRIAERLTQIEDDLTAFSELLHAAGHQAAEIVRSLTLALERIEQQRP